jgi:hypothetical protein
VKARIAAARAQAFSFFPGRNDADASSSFRRGQGCIWIRRQRDIHLEPQSSGALHNLPCEFLWRAKHAIRAGDLERNGACCCRFNKR